MGLPPQEISKKEVTPAERWELQKLSLCRICNVSCPGDLLNIYKRVAPLQKENTRVALDIDCQNKARELRYKATRISHIVAGLLLSLAFYTEDPDGIGNTATIFLLPGLYLLEISQSTLVARIWDTALDSSTFTSFVDTAALIQRKKVAPIIG